ncbi:hypothetical protein SNE40_016564 [Patella caerulea]|uniref:Ig-like domain-containing protein n=1 Tax=Patella caerulea TaxID=87958 RepID=A0AAN8PNR7_PATCE
MDLGLTGFGIFSILSLIHGEFIVPSAITADLDETVILECRLEGNYRWYAISWQKQTEDGTSDIIVTLPVDTKQPDWNNQMDAYYRQRYEPIINSNADVLEFSLRINGLTCVDRGTYSCNVMGNFPVKSKSTEVTVTSVATRPDINYDELSLERNSTFDIECEAEVGFPPGELVWLYKAQDSPVFHILGDEEAQETNSITPCRRSAVKKHRLEVTDDVAGSTFRCALRGRHTEIDFFDDVKIQLTGLPTTPEPEPECDGVVCITENDDSNSVTTYVCYNLLLCCILLNFLNSFYH